MPAKLKSPKCNVKYKDENLYAFEIASIKPLLGSCLSFVLGR